MGTRVPAEDPLATLRIGELLVQAGLVTEDQVEQALTAQRIHGGRLGTNLIVLGFVSERQLAGALSSQLGIPLVETDRLEVLHPEVLSVIPKHLAERYRVVPFEVEPESGRTSIASAEPSNLHQMDELQFVLERRLRLYLCPELVLASALERHYGIAREARFVALSKGPVQARKQPPPSASATTGTFRRSGPCDVLARLLDAGDREGLVAALLESLGAFARQRVLFAARGETLSAWEGRGLPLEREALRRVVLDPSRCPAAGRVLAGAGGRVDCEPESWAPIEEALFADHEGGALLLPVRMGSRTWGALLAAGLREPRLVDDPSYLEAVLDRFALRLQAIELNARAAQPLPTLG